MKRKLLTVLMISAMVLAGSTVSKADDVFDSNTEESSEINMDTEGQTEANPENVISIPEEIVEEDSDKEKNTEDSITTYADGIAIDEAHFPDENFREYLKDFDEDGDSYFSQDEIDNVTSIDVSGNSTIKNLAGINYFTNLESLVCYWLDDLVSLDVSGNPNLKTLECGKSKKFTTLNISKNSNLQILKCENSSLMELDVSNNLNLQTLVCSGNQLTVLDISKHPNLQILECANNQLMSLDVRSNPSLQTLNCGGNQIATLDVSNNPNLQSLLCGGNQLTTLNVSGNPILSRLWCNVNQLSNLDISKNSKLTQVFCDNNQLKELDIKNNKLLICLGCKGNQLTSLDISNNPVLEGLDCSDNQLSNLNAKNSEVKTLWCINNKLTSLDLSENTQLGCLRCYNNNLTKLDLSYNRNMPIRTGDYDNPNLLHFSMGGAYAEPQNTSANIVSINGTWTLDLAAIVGKENLSRVILATDGAKLSADGTVTFSDSTMPTELVYNYDTKNPAEDTPMTVHVALTRNNVDDQTGKDVTVDTGDLDIDKICKENNISINANFEIILSQGTPSKENLDKLTQATGKNGYSIKATYEILMSLLSDGQKIADITDNFGRIKLTFQVDASLAGQNAIVYQLHNNSQVIVHDGLTINTDGTVTITVDKFSTFALAVKPSSNNTGKPNTDQSGTNKPDTNRPDTNKPDSNRPDTNQPDTNQPNGNQPDTNQLSPKTGDGTNPVFWIIVAMAASIVGILSRKRHYTK